MLKAITDKWTDTHSEEIKRGITIKIGYVDAGFYITKDGRYTVSEKEQDGVKNKLLRRVSFLDAPGHETLMTTAIAASSITDGALFVIAANEKCPQPQTQEHLTVLDILGIKNIVIVQNKVDLVSRERSLENYKEIAAFVKGSIAENAPIIPIAANYKTNIDALIEAIEKNIPTPKRNPDAAPKMFVARSFDVNRPGVEIAKMRGGVLGGSLICGKLKVGDEIEIRPGIRKKSKDREVTEPIITKVTSLLAGEKLAEEVGPGGLVGIGTPLDPALTKSDLFVGNIIGKPGALPQVLEEIDIEYTILQRQDFENPGYRMQEPIVISVGTATSIGVITRLKGGVMQLKLKRPICADKKSKVAISRRVGQRWRLSGHGVLK
jgi:translation initiation factor 2 subunit 3